MIFSLCRCLFLSISLSVCLPACLPLCLSVCLSVCLSSFAQRWYISVKECTTSRLAHKSDAQSTSLQSLHPPRNGDSLATGRKRQLMHVSLTPPLPLAETPGINTQSAVQEIHCCLQRSWVFCFVSFFFVFRVHLSAGAAALSWGAVI